MKRFIQMLLAVAIIQILLIVTLTPGRASNFSLGKVEKSGPSAIPLHPNHQINNHEEES
jgi:hypothetical protein